MSDMSKENNFFLNKKFVLNSYSFGGFKGTDEGPEMPLRCLVVNSIYRNDRLEK